MEDTQDAPTVDAAQVTKKPTVPPQLPPNPISSVPKTFTTIPRDVMREILDCVCTLTYIADMANQLTRTD